MSVAIVVLVDWRQVLAVAAPPVASMLIGCFFYKERKN